MLANMAEQRAIVKKPKTIDFQFYVIFPYFCALNTTNVKMEQTLREIRIWRKVPQETLRYRCAYCFYKIQYQKSV